MDLQILELFSGIGGMHYAFKESQIPGQILAAMDINTIANEVYIYNNRQTNVLNNNVQKLDVKILKKLQINCILMSPPCQPHTRLGHRKDIEDNRSHGLMHICSLLPECKFVHYILMENVKGFEESLAHSMYIEALKKGGFYYREFILSPTQLNIPNTRYRYYCMARRDKNFSFQGERIWYSFPIIKEQKKCINTIMDILESNDLVCRDFLVDEKTLDRRVLVMDIVTFNSINTMCFTKAYTHYIEGTGSVFCPLKPEAMHQIFEKLAYLDKDNSSKENKLVQRRELLQSLRLRYFTPREVARLMCFPETFDFPLKISNRQKYRLLGNSVNVKLVSELIKLLYL
uniref:tRNA (cytosine(38)-C(5))-methyltransferase n=1 Tax=Glossina brevipalpis TaxID=37001 RepID=A0A1A9W237_9MUSC